jgi:hypothetical protein
MIVRLPKRVGLLAVMLIAAILIALRAPLLRVAGLALVAEDPVTAADVIVIAVDADGAGVLEAVDLVQEGIAMRVGVFADPPDSVDREFLRRGVPYEDRAERSTRQLNRLGVTMVEKLAAASGTEDEAAVLAEWCARTQITSVVVVSSSDHSRRLRRTLHRSINERMIRVMVRRARHSTFDPDEWWKSRDGVRTEIQEGQKLLLDVARHPFS